MNKKGPGEAFFIKCDMSKEEDIKVKYECTSLVMASWVVTQRNLLPKVFIRLWPG